MKNIIQFFKEALVEFRHVTWPTKEQLQKHTIQVLGFVIVFVLFIGGVDFLFGAGFQYAIKDVTPKTYQEATKTNATAEVNREAVSPEVKANTNSTAPTQNTNAAATNVNAKTTPALPPIQAVDEKGNPIEGVTITPVTEKK